MKKSLNSALKRIAKELLFPVPSRISNNFIQIDRAGLSSIEKSITENYHKGYHGENGHLQEVYKKDLNDHLYVRLENDRRRIIPWLDNASTLRNKRVLEIGCGTGCSTIAMAEQGARITGIDIDEGALVVAKDRSRVYGVSVDFKLLNAHDISSAFKTDQFDMIIFYASLEHMTIAERLSSLKMAWGMLSPDGLLVVVETPNRLWYFDSHTSFLPFFHWLPNELAFEYSRFSSRENFNNLYIKYDETSKNHFLRRGRGFSFHEFDIAIRPAKDLKVISSLSTFEGIRYRLMRSRLSRRFKVFLMSIYPSVHEGFFDDVLYLIIKKD